MDTTLIIFAISLLLIIFMIAHKMFELRTGKGLLFNELHRKVDKVAVEWHGSVFEKISFFTKENLKTVGRLIYVVCYRAIRGAKRRAEAVYNQFHHEMKERAVIKKENVSPSFFLKNVSEYKDKPVR